jgi:hypothetical protein
MATGDVSEGERHSEDRESESESDAGEADADCGKAGGQHGCAASAKYQPEGSNEFRCCTFTNRHGDPLELQ